MGIHSFNIACFVSYFCVDIEDRLWLHRYSGIIYIFFKINTYSECKFADQKKDSKLLISEEWRLEHIFSCSM